MTKQLKANTTIAALIEQLTNLIDEGFDPETPVVTSHVSGDHWRSVLANEVDSVELGRVKWSTYHRCWQVENEDSDDVEDAEPNALIIC